MKGYDTYGIAADGTPIRATRGGVDEIAVGQKMVYAFMRRPDLCGVECVVVCKTGEPGKLVGVAFKTKVDGGDTLDGRVPAGHGRWVHPDHLVTLEAHAEAQAQAAAWSQNVSEARSIADAFISE